MEQANIVAEGLIDKPLVDHARVKYTTSPARSELGTTLNFVGSQIRRIATAAMACCEKNFGINERARTECRVAVVVENDPNYAQKLLVVCFVAVNHSKA